MVKRLIVGTPGAVTLLDGVGQSIAFSIGEGQVPLEAEPLDDTFFINLLVAAGHNLEGLGVIVDGGLARYQGRYGLDVGRRVELLVEPLAVPEDTGEVILVVELHQGVLHADHLRSDALRLLLVGAAGYKDHPAGPAEADDGMDHGLLGLLAVDTVEDGVADHYVEEAPALDGGGHPLEVPDIPGHVDIIRPGLLVVGLHGDDVVALPHQAEGVVLLASSEIEDPRCLRQAVNEGEGVLLIEEAPVGVRLALAAVAEAFLLGVALLVGFLLEHIVGEHAVLLGEVADGLGHLALIEAEAVDIVAGDLRGPGIGGAHAHPAVRGAERTAEVPVLNQQLRQDIAHRVHIPERLDADIAVLDPVEGDRLERARQAHLRGLGRHFHLAGVVQLVEAYLVGVIEVMEDVGRCFGDTFRTHRLGALVPCDDDVVLRPDEDGLDDAQLPDRPAERLEALIRKEARVVLRALDVGDPDGLHTEVTHRRPLHPLALQPPDRAGKPRSRSSPRPSPRARRSGRRGPRIPLRSSVSSCC